LIRGARVEDLAGIAAVEVHAFGPAAWTEAQVAAQLADPGSAFLLSGEPQPQGYVLMRAAADEAEVLRIAVAPEARTRGVGTALLAAGLAWAAARGVRRVFLEVASDNAPALALYARLGFRTVGERRSYYGAGRHALIQARSLAPPGYSHRRQPW
jgi:ribosomal-protein-alanine N-acetyltransferase